MDNLQINSSGKRHWLHVAANWVAKFFSCLSVIALVLAWVATFRGTVFGLIAPHWYWSALIFGVLALCKKIIWVNDCDKTC